MDDWLFHRSTASIAMDSISCAYDTGIGIHMVSGGIAGHADR